MRNYILTLVFKPNANKEEVLKEISDILAETGGKISSQEDLAIKKLAYPIKKSLEGEFYRVNVSTDPTFPSKMSEILRISDNLLRFIITSGDVVTTSNETIKEETK